MIPHELVRILESDVFKNQGHIELSNLSNQRGHTLIEFIILGIPLKKQESRWTVEIFNLHSSSTSQQIFNSLEVIDEHFLIHESRSTKSILYIKKPSMDLNATLIELESYFNRKYAGEIDIYRYLSKGFSLSEILQQSHCKFGDFPDLIVDEILSILESYGCEPYIYQANKRKVNHQNNNGPLKLLRLGDSLFVAQHFSFFKSLSFLEILLKNLKKLVGKLREQMGYQQK